MKKYLILFIGIAALGTHPLVAQTTASTSPSTTTPDSGNYKSSASFQTSWEDYLATMKGKPVDIICIGDSITQQWRWGNGKPVWQKYYADRALDFGQSGDRTQHVLWRLQHLDIKEFKPKVAVILIGTNNTLDPPEDIAAGVKAVIDSTRETFPNVKIILVSILPNERANEKMMAANALLQTFANDQTLFHLDLLPGFPREGDNWLGLQSDKLHLTTAGYETWAAALNPLLAKLGVPVP